MIAAYVFCARSTPVSDNFKDYDYDAVLKYLIVLSLFVAIVRLGYWTQPLEELLQRQPRGPVTILRALALLNSLSFALSATLLIHKRSKIIWFLFFINAFWICLEVGLLTKRNAMLFTAIAIASAFWFSYRKKLQRSILLILMPLAIVANNSISDFRTNNPFADTYLPGKYGDESRPFADVIADLVAEGPLVALPDKVLGQDLANGAHLVDHYARNGGFDYGAGLWNSFISNYVPGQLVGYDLKQSLYIKLGSGLSAYDLNPHAVMGTTASGFAIAFRSFAWAGACLYSILGALVGATYARAMRGSLAAQVLYPALVLQVIIALSHSVYAPFAVLPMLLAGVLPLTWARRRRPGAVWAAAEAGGRP